MSKIVVYTWPQADVAAVSALQTTAGAGTLLLNGTLAKPIYNGLYIPFFDQYRTVSLTSLNNLSGVNVTITGTLQGAVVTSTIVGPNDDTVYTSQLYDSVTAVTVNGAVTAMSVGSGSTGQTAWFTYDRFAPYAALTCACVATSTINYSLQVTLDSVFTNPTPHVFTPVTTLTAATGSILAQVTPIPISYANVIVNSSSGTGSCRGYVCKPRSDIMSKAKWIQGAIKHPGALHKELHVPQGQRFLQRKWNKQCILVTL